MLDVVEELFQQGVELHKSGKVEVACQLYTAVLKAHPEHPTANHNMGVLAVDVGKVQEALPFFEAALEANADTAQFWLSYIDALINVERIADAQAVFDQAKNNGAQGDGFDQLERRLNVPGQEPLESSVTASRSTSGSAKYPGHSKAGSSFKAGKEGNPTKALLKKPSVSIRIFW